MTIVFDQTPGETTWHLVQRGLQRRTCFRCDRDYRNYAYWLYKYSRRYEVVIHAWVFMPEHVHLLCSSPDGWACPEMLQSIARQYQRYLCEHYGSRNPIWDEQISAHPVQGEGQVLRCYRYIELHPQRSDLVQDTVEYTWSSYASNAMGLRDVLCSPHREYLALGGDRVARRLAYQSLFQAPLPAAALADIRRCLSEGLGL